VQNGTWELAQLPPGKRAIGSRWIFKVRGRRRGWSISKGRLVAQGFSQIPGVFGQDGTVVPEGQELHNDMEAEDSDIGGFFRPSQQSPAPASPRNAALGALGENPQLALNGLTCVARK